MFTCFSETCSTIQFTTFRYDKTEDPEIVAAKIEERAYTHLLVGTPDEHETQAIIAKYSTTYKYVHTEMCFKGTQLSKRYPFIDIKLAPCVWIFQSKNK